MVRLTLKTQKMIKSKEEYYSILERLRTMNFNQKLSKNLQAKLEAFEEMEELVNLTIPVVVSSAKTQTTDDDEGYIYCPNCGRVKESD